MDHQSLYEIPQVLNLSMSKIKRQSFKPQRNDELQDVVVFAQAVYNANRVLDQAGTLPNHQVRDATVLPLLVDIEEELLLAQCKGERARVRKWPWINCSIRFAGEASQKNRSWELNC